MLGLDPIHNYMTYADDQCLTEHTPQQIARLRSLGPALRPHLTSWVPLAETGVEDTPIGNQLRWLANTTNPLHSHARVGFVLSQASRVKLSVLDVAGHQVDVVVDADLGAGEHTYTWRAEGIRPGVYFVLLRAGNEQLHKRLVLIR
ncbi:MAG: T9SS type A sorting domain-containing protein [Armatimonadota bacterium]